ncbi:cobyrinate a,c-diamide synthase [Kytococcus sp. Marseille-QA3725]
MRPLPRLVVAAPASGHGKTTLATGLMAALTARGLAVAPAKVGPDFVDPRFHATATGRPGRNLDPWLQEPDRVDSVLARSATVPEPADVAVVEGVLGLFDGRLGTEGWSSTAHVAHLIGAPVLLVVDVSSASRTVGAVVHGLATYDPGVQVGGVVLNRVGSARHAAEVRHAVEATGVPVLGVVPRSAELAVPSRHLGLVPVERDDGAATVARMGQVVTDHLDLDAVLELAYTAPDLSADPWEPPRREPATADGEMGTPERPVVAVAGGPAFGFCYPETLELLRARGLDPVEFDPLRADALPEGARGLLLPGGYPEDHAAELAARTPLLASLADAVRSGLPTWAEGGGMHLLLDALDGHRMSGVVPDSAWMGRRSVLGYREATATADTLLCAAGTTVRGHEIHRTRLEQSGSPAAWQWDDAADGFSLDAAGEGHPTLHGSFLHTHPVGHPELGCAFAEAVHRATAVPAPPTEHAPDGMAPGTMRSAGPVEVPGADHHGDAELAPGLEDFAVNVRVPQPPAELLTVLQHALTGAAAYPDPAAAREAVAARHGLHPACVLPTNGAAEAFTLLARAVDCADPVTVHPQFGEPDEALRRAGRPARALVLDTDPTSPTAVLDADRLTREGPADLVVVGNPTNPTGRLHPAEDLLALASPGRVLLVDEAFMDLVPGEPESLLHRHHHETLRGVLVVRSLTKTWGVAGVRAGYVAGDPELVAALAGQQPHWSVNGLALATLEHAATPAGAERTEAWAHEVTAHREHLVTGLRALGLDPLPSVAPFVTVRVGHGIHAALRTAGFAVRRCDTFPGLDGSWIRVAVRPPETTDRLLRALAAALSPTGGPR